MCGAPQDRIWRHDRGEFSQRLATESLSFDGQQTPLVVSQQHSLPTEFLEESFYLGVLKLDDLLLTLIDKS